MTTMLFKLVPVGNAIEFFPVIQLDQVEDGRYTVSCFFDGQCTACDKFIGLEDALLRVAGTVHPRVTYTSGGAPMEVLTNGIGSGGTGSRRQDAISGNKTTTMDFPDAEEWRARGI